MGASYCIEHAKIRLNVKKTLPVTEVGNFRLLFSWLKLRTVNYRYARIMFRRGNANCSFLIQISIKMNTSSYKNAKPTMTSERDILKYTTVSK